MIHPFDIAVLEPGDEYAWRPDYGTLPLVNSRSQTGTEL